MNTSESVGEPNSADSAVQLSLSCVEACVSGTVLVRLRTRLLTQSTFSCIYETSHELVPGVRGCTHAVVQDLKPSEFFWLPNVVLKTLLLFQLLFSGFQLLLPR